MILTICYEKRTNEKYHSIKDVAKFGINYNLKKDSHSDAILFSFLILNVRCSSLIAIQNIKF